MDIEPVKRGKRAKESRVDDVGGRDPLGFYGVFSSCGQIGLSRRPAMPDNFAAGWPISVAPIRCEPANAYI